MSELQRFQYTRMNASNNMETDSNFNDNVRMCGWGTNEQALEYAYLINSNEWNYIPTLSESQIPEERDFNVADAIEERSHNLRCSNPPWNLNDSKIMNGQEAEMLDKILASHSINAPVNYKDGLQEMNTKNPDWVAEQSFWELLKPLIENGAALEQDILHEQELSKVAGDINQQVRMDNNDTKDYPMPAMNKEAQLEYNTRKVRKFIDRYKSHFPLAVFNKTEQKELKPEKPKTVILARTLQEGKILQKATKLPVYVGSNTLKNAAEALKEKLPEANITICVDNMHNFPTNIALEDALDGAKLIKAAVSIPAFNHHEMQKGLHSFSSLNEARGPRGLQAVKESAQNPIVNYGDKYREPKAQERILADAKKSNSQSMSR